MLGVFYLLILAMLWGGSFLFMRIGINDFSPISLISMRVTIAALFLIPFLFLYKKQKNLAQNFTKISLTGCFNSAIPFCLLAYATTIYSAGFTSILNAITPVFAGLIGFLFFNQKLTKLKILGLIICFVGVVLLLGEEISTDLGFNLKKIIAALAGILACVFYGASANYTQKNLKNVAPIAMACGSQIGSSILLAPFAIYFWPENIALKTWIAVFALGIFSTGVAFILFFRLISMIGATLTTTVTFLVPVFAMLWGWIFLNEKITLSMLIASAIIFIGSAFTLGFVDNYINKNRYKTSIKEE